MSESIKNKQSVKSSKDNFGIKKILKSYIYTIIASVGTALFFYVIGLTKPLFYSLIVFLSCSLSCCSLGIIAEWLWPGRVSPLKLLGIIVVICLAGGIIGWHIGVFILYYFFSITTDLGSSSYISSMMFVSVLAGITVPFIYYHLRLKETKEDAEKERLNRLTIEKEALEANLRLLQAQIEPHFLFNTLSNILSLIDTAPAKAKNMLMDFNLYLRTSLATTRPDMTTLDEEVDTIKAYLNIQKIRLGNRLKYSINIPDIILQQAFPPLLLQPIVENAVKHGLEPDIDGGEIKIIAESVNGIMRITVADTGKGFSSHNKTGVGISNVKERIKLIYGNKGSFNLEENYPTGAKVIVEVPKSDI